MILKLWWKKNLVKVRKAERFNEYWIIRRAFSNLGMARYRAQL